MKVRRTITQKVYRRDSNSWSGRQSTKPNATHWDKEKSIVKFTVTICAEPPVDKTYCKTPASWGKTTTFTLALHIAFMADCSTCSKWFKTLKRKESTLTISKTTPSPKTVSTYSYNNYNNKTAPGSQTICTTMPKTKKTQTFTSKCSASGGSCPNDHTKNSLNSTATVSSNTTIKSQLTGMVSSSVFLKAASLSMNFCLTHSGMSDGST